MQFFPLQLFSTPCDLGKSSQIMTTGSSHLSSWCFPNPLFKKKSRYPAGLDLARAFQLPAKTLPPRVSCCCWRRRTPLCDCRKWRAVKRAQISAERSCSSLKRRRGVKFKFPPWMPKVFFKSSLLQCYITVCGKHRAAEKRRSRGGSCSTKPRPAGSYTFLFLISFLPLPSETKGHFIRLVMICISVSLSANPMKVLKRTVNRSS